MGHDTGMYEIHHTYPPYPLQSIPIMLYLYSMMPTTDEGVWPSCGHAILMKRRRGSSIYFLSFIPLFPLLFCFFTSSLLFLLFLASLLFSYSDKCTPAGTVTIRFPTLVTMTSASGYTRRRQVKSQTGKALVSLAHNTCWNSEGNTCPTHLHALHRLLWPLTDMG